jgi:hypothetical protein
LRRRTVILRPCHAAGIARGRTLWHLRMPDRRER